MQTWLTKRQLMRVVKDFPETPVFFSERGDTLTCPFIHPDGPETYQFELKVVLVGQKEKCENSENN